MRPRNQARSAGLKAKTQAISNGSMTLPAPSMPLLSGGNKGTRLPLIASSPTTPSAGSLFGNLMDESQGGHGQQQQQHSHQQQQQQMLWASSSRHVGFAVGVCSQQGKRPYQEDEYSIRQFLTRNGIGGDPETHFFGLFDGHAGGRCSQHLANSLATALTEDEAYISNLPQAIKRAFHTVNENFLKIAEKMKLHDGSTGICAVIRDNKVIVANVGDCRTLIISNGRPIQMSTDHKPTNVEEQKRIASFGGSVVNCMGVARVNRVLAVSRAFGNRTLRTVIRPDAELTQRDLADGDDFIVMASDGLWDVLKNKDVSDVCYSPYLQRKPQVIADELVQMALARGSMDNVTCVVVNLGDYRARATSDENHRSNTNNIFHESESKHDSFEPITTPKQFKKMMENTFSSSGYGPSQDEDGQHSAAYGGFRRFDGPSSSISGSGNGLVGIADAQNALRPLTAIEAFGQGPPLNNRHGNSMNLSGSGQFRPSSQGGAPMRLSSPNNQSSKTVSETIVQQKAAFPSHIKSMRAEGKNSVDY